MTPLTEGPSFSSSRLCPDEAVDRWIEKHLATAPRFSDDQLREMGVILGVQLTRRTSTQG
ncbi:hypothetical protein GCM10009759_42130 [Kitasatospora saccharophila]|uniref:Uncharacterized protein n=1 Tax=Kitasatospora saccharophila TaxID=407973 RepID=A0ABP5IRB6_9ACTN